VLNAPTLGWRDVDLRDNLTALTGFPVQVENAAKACALAQMWLGRNEIDGAQHFAFVSVSDGVGVGLVINGELVRVASILRGGSNSLQHRRPAVCAALLAVEAYISISRRSLGIVQSSKIRSRDIFSTRNEHLR